MTLIIRKRPTYQDPKPQADGDPSPANLAHSISTTDVDEREALWHLELLMRPA